MGGVGLIISRWAEETTVTGTGTEKIFVTTLETTQKAGEQGQPAGPIRGAAFLLGCLTPMTDLDLPFPDNSLAPHEEQRFQALEQTVEGGLRDFQRTGQALAEIRDNHLFRETHADFETYLRDRWGFNLRQADRIIDAAVVARQLEPLGIEPRHERQASTFKPAVKIIGALEPEQQRLISRLVEERRGAGSDVPPWEDAAAPELKIMANVVQKLTPEKTVYHPESGDEVELGTLSPAQRYEVVREHVVQKAQAYHEKQAARAQQPPRERVNWADWFIAYAAEHLDHEQQLELVIEQGEGGPPRAVARVMSKVTGEVLAQGEPSDDLKRAVMTLRGAVSG